jgi:hypothetical protein
MAIRKKQKKTVNEADWLDDGLILLFCLFVTYIGIFGIYRPFNNVITEEHPVLQVLCNAQFHCSSKCILQTENVTMIIEAAREKDCNSYNKTNNISGRGKCTCGGLM